MKKLILAASLFLSIGCMATTAIAQSMAVKKIMAKYDADYIPEFKSSLASRSSNPALANIDVEIDYASFGDNAEELDLAVRELNQVKGAILFLAKDAAGKSAIESGLKKILIRKAGSDADRNVSLTNGTLTLAPTSFDLRTLIGTAEIQKYLENKL